MTNEQLNTALYEKLFAEQETYRAWLLSQPPEEILNHTYCCPRPAGAFAPQEQRPPLSACPPE